MKVRISKAVAADFQGIEMAGIDATGYPMTDGDHDLSEGMFYMIYGYVKSRAEGSEKPALKTAMNALKLQMEKTIELENVGIESVSHAKQDERFIVLQKSDLLINDQVRSVFDDESVRELADDIAEHGLINPITVRHAHPGNHDWSYILVAGERRLRACELAGHPILAQVLDVDRAGARGIQLAENIHREDLGIADKAKAVRELYDELGTMKAVAEKVKKSKAWVSKLIAVTEPDFGWRAKKLLEDGECEDLEVLGLISQVEKTCAWEDAEEAIRRFKVGELNREEAREFLRVRKEMTEADRQKDIEEALQEEMEAEQLLASGGVDADLARAKAEVKEAKESLKRAEEKAKENAALPAAEALLNLVKFYVVFQKRDFGYRDAMVAMNYTLSPFAGSDAELENAWRDAVDCLTEAYGSHMTELYYQNRV